MKMGWEEFFSYTRFKAGDGSKIRLWNDKWCANQVLKDIFLNFYSIACVKDAFMAYYLELPSHFHQWNVSFIIDAHNWEVDVFTSFFKLLYSFKLRQGGEEKLRWDLSKRGIFDVKSFYNVLASHDNTLLPLEEYLVE